MTIRCGACRLEPQKRAAVDAALRGNVPLEELARTSGLSKSSLHRHGQHLDRPLPDEAPARQMTTPEPAAAVATVPEPEPEPEADGVPLAADKRLRVSGKSEDLPDNQRPHAPAATPDPPSRSQLLQRVELLWDESLAGLAAAKESVTLTRPDGSSILVPGDLRARVGFLRVGATIAELGGKATGELNHEQPGGTNIYIVSAAVSLNTAAAPEPLVIDVTPDRKT